MGGELGVWRNSEFVAGRQDKCWRHDASQLKLRHMRLVRICDGLRSRDVRRQEDVEQPGQRQECRERSYASFHGISVTPEPSGARVKNPLKKIFSNLPIYVYSQCGLAPRVMGREQGSHMEVAIEID